MTALPRAIMYRGKPHEINWDTDNDMLGCHGVAQINHNWGEGDSNSHNAFHRPTDADEWCCEIISQSLHMRVHPEPDYWDLYMIGGDYGDAVSRITSHADGSIRLYWRPYN